MSLILGAATGLGVNFITYCITLLIENPKSFKGEISNAIKKTEKQYSLDLSGLKETIKDNNANLIRYLFESDKNKKELLLRRFLIKEAQSGKISDKTYDAINVYDIFNSFIVSLEENLLLNEKFSIIFLKKSIEGQINDSTSVIHQNKKLLEEQTLFLKRLSSENFINEVGFKYAKIKWELYKSELINSIEQGKLVYKNHGVVNEKIVNLFRDHLFKKNWKEGIIDFVNFFIHRKPERFSEAAQTFQKELSNLRIDSTFETVRYNLLGIYNSLKKSSNDFAEIRKNTSKEFQEKINELDVFLKSERFYNCFLLSGPFGAGKTQSVCDIMKSDSKILPLLVSKENFHTSLEKSLLYLFEKIIGINLKSINQVIEFLAIKPKNEKVVIIIDEIELINLRNTDIVKELEFLIKEFSASQYVYWYISIDSNYLDIILNQERFFKDYSGMHTLFQDNEEITKPIDFGWINLEKINSKEKTGHKLLQKELNHAKFSSIEESILRYLNNPLLAWIYIVTEKQNNSKLEINNYLDFYIAYWIVLKESIDGDMVKRKCDLYINILSQIIIETTQISFIKRDIIKTVSDQDNVFREPSEVESLLEVIIGLNLLAADVDNNRTNFIDSVDINHDFFWQYRIANFFDSVNIDKIEKILLSDIDDYIKDFFIRIIENVLILRTEDEIRNSDFLPLVINNKNIPCYTLFNAAIKSNEVVQNYIFDFLIEDNDYDIVQTKKDIILLILFMSTIEDTNEFIYKKFKLIKRIFLKAVEQNLKEYLYKEIVLLVKKTENIGTLGGILKILLDFHQLGYSKEIAKSIFNRADELLKGEVIDVDRFFIKRLKKEALKDNYLSPKESKHYSPYYIGEWILQYLSNFINRRWGAWNTYEYFKKNEWYSNNNRGNLVKLHHEANISIGRNFKKANTQKRKKDFLKLTNYLSGTKNANINERGFFIIKHTTNMYEYEEIVDNILLPDLAKIVKRNSKQDYIKNHRKFLIKNRIRIN